MDNKEQVLSRLREDTRIIQKHIGELYNPCPKFLKYCNRPVEQLDVDDIRNFLWYLIHEKKSSPGTVKYIQSSHTFLFAVTLNRTLNYLQIPRQKKRKTLPEVFNEGRSLLHYGALPKHQTQGHADGDL